MVLLFRHCLIIFTLSLPNLKISNAGNAVLVNNGFQNVTVAISSAITQSQESSLISGLQNLFETASSKLFTATGKRAYFATIVIARPQNWNANGLSASLSDAESETYYNADFRIANPNVAYGDLPYTQQSRGCGEPGDFIHLTPEFITDSYSIEQKYGPAENLLVKEWVKYRYGVFDENGFAFDPTYPQMYFGQNDTSDTVTTEYNMCNNTVITWTTRTCYYDGDVQGIPSNCILQISTSTSYNRNVTSSMMSMITLPVATTLCNETDHNSAAPNKQNNLCNGKSVMEVVLEHEDFQSGRNPPSDMYIPNPSFYQESQSENATIIFFLVWDPLTLDQTYYTAGPALLKFIYLDFPEESYFGAIDSVDTTMPFIRLTQVVESNRDSLWNQMVARLRTSETPVGNVLAAVEGAIRELQTNNSVAGAYSKGIVVMSNTEDETPWSEVCSKAISNNVDLYLVTYNQYVAEEFDNSNCLGWAIVIGNETPNNDTTNHTLTDDMTMSEDIKACLTYLEERGQLDLALMNFPALISPAFAFPSVYHLRTYFNSTEDTFVVDATQLDSTFFYVETCTNLQEHPPATLMSCWLNDPNNIYGYDSTIQAFFNDEPLSENGIWSFGVSQSTVRDILAPYTVYAIGSSIPKSLSAANDTVITVRTWIDTSINAYYQPKVRFFASVNRGTNPVFNARVQATVRNSEDSATTQIILLDNGSGNPDISANDGVYSSYFTQFAQSVNNKTVVSVAYYVQIDADDNGGIANYPVGPYPWISGEKRMEVKYTQLFVQKEIAKFSYGLTPMIEAMPPGNISDLRVVATQGATVTLEWTAPGADYDYGLASSYIFKCSTDRHELINDFDHLPESEIPDVQPGLPKYAQTVTFVGINDKKAHFCAIKVYDEYGLHSAMSNIISYYVESR